MPQPIVDPAPQHRDWGEASESYDSIREFVASKNLADANEAQTRYDVIDRLIREVLGWRHGQVDVEEYSPTDSKAGYVDYLLRGGDATIVVEAKKAGATFPSPTRKKELKLTGSVLNSGEIGAAIKQATQYAETKDADVVVVTNGLCWCFYPRKGTVPASHATLLFPFEFPQDAERLFEFLAQPNVEAGSIRRMAAAPAPREDRLLSVFKYADGRIDRNNFADHIMPALERALYDGALLTNPEQLEKCFITTEARTKFDTTLGMHLADPKPKLIEPAKRIRTGKERGPLDALVQQSGVGYAPPVTLIIGPVGAGKSTYLKHFELVSGREVLAGRDAHWIYVDFEEMGQAGNPRAYLYQRLLGYLQTDRASNPIDYQTVIGPAYESEIAALLRGPLSLIARDKDEVNRRVTEHIQRDYERVEPYVDKVFGYLAKSRLCVIVLDNIDLYEDDVLETAVFAEGLALSRRVLCNVLVSVRDKTFVRHRHDSVFNAYELRKFWIDPPPLKSVISSRLTYSKKILAGRSARIEFQNGIVLNVQDLSFFFDIVQKSILGGDAGDYVDAVAGGDIRKGLTLVRNFLTSGHIEADRALKQYVNEGDKSYTFPFHEIFKGTMLGQWQHFREDRAECINLYDSRLGSRKLRLMRLHLLEELLIKAYSEESVEVPVRHCVEMASRMGASEAQVISTLQFLSANGLVRNVTAEEVSGDSTVVLTRTGGYYTRNLSARFVYTEECMFDTAIEDEATWLQLCDLTDQIENEKSVGSRLKQRRARIEVFADYLAALDDDAWKLTGSTRASPMVSIRERVLLDADDAVASALRYEPGGRYGRPRR